MREARDLAIRLRAIADDIEKAANASSSRALLIAGFRLEQELKELEQIIKGAPNGKAL